MAKGLTEKQRTILEYIIDFQRDRGFPPTIRELGDAFSIRTLRGVTTHLEALTRKGFVTRGRTSRSIRITGLDPRDPSDSPPPETPVSLPLIRRSPRGDRLLVGKKAVPPGRIERHIAIPEELAGPATSSGFVIRVDATGVPGEPILPGDLLVVRPQDIAQTGDLIVTFSSGDIRVCRADEDVVSLLPPLSHAATEKPNSLPAPRETEILGRVVGLIRRY